MRRIALFAALALTAQLGSAAAAVATDPKQAPAGTYDVEPRHTVVMFAISHFGLTDYYGRFEKASGTLNFVPGAPEKSALSVKIDMSSLNVPSPELITELAAANVFDSAKFPEATFTAKGITRTGASTGQMTGDLTLHGVTKPVTFDVTFNGGMASPMSPTTYLLGFHATTAIKRSDFGLDKTMWSSMVGADVKLSIDVLFQKQKS